MPELIVDLDRATGAGDWQRARAIHYKIYPLSVAIYRKAPGNRATARLKACLRLLGRIPNAAARPPICPLGPEELEDLERALAVAQQPV